MKERRGVKCVVLTGQAISFLMLGVLASPKLFAQGETPMAEEVFWEDVPMVMSATRLAQPVIDAPVAVTVIDREMIEASGAREIPELLRLVPGFIVGYKDGHTPSVSNHISQDGYARRMQVLVDGRSVYVTAFGGVPWAGLPVTIDDIERIEVVRGPNSSSYGANSYLGVISIITRHALSDQGVSVKVNLGDEGVHEGFVRAGSSSGNFDYRMNLNYVEDKGFPQRYDSKRVRGASFRGDYTVSTRENISFQTGVKQGPLGEENLRSDPTPRHYKEILSHFQQLDWERQLGVGENVSVKIHHIYNREMDDFMSLVDTSNFITDASFAPIPAGLPAVVVIPPILYGLSLRTERYNIEAQHTVELGERVRLVWGGGARQDSAWSSRLLGDNVEIGNHLNYGFANAEWSMDHNWLVNAGLMVEDYHTTGTDTSPRLGVNYKFSERQSVRATVSKAIRTPSIYEYAADWSQQATLLLSVPDVGVFDFPYPTFSQSTLGTQNVSPERIISTELGYNATTKDGLLSYDVKLFRDKFNDMIVQNYVADPADNFDGRHLTFTNLDSIAIRGLELDANYTPSEELRIKLGYAYAETDFITHNYRYDYQKLTPQNNFNILLIKKFPNDYIASAAYYFLDKVQGWETDDIRDPTRRLDLRLARTISNNRLKMEIALALRNVLGKYEELEVLRPKSRYEYINLVDPSAYLSLKISFQ